MEKKNPVCQFLKKTKALKNNAKQSKHFEQHKEFWHLFLQKQTSTLFFTKFTVEDFLVKNHEIHISKQVTFLKSTSDCSFAI